MKKLFTKGRIALLVIFSVLIIDQIIKIWIKTHMYWHESIRVTDWFYIYFTENNGMAFGMEIFGKLFLTTFRIVAVALIGWYLYKIIKKVCFMEFSSMKALIRRLPALCPKAVDILPGFMEKWWICFIFRL